MITDQDMENNTALHLAVENGHYEVVSLCLEKSMLVFLPSFMLYSDVYDVCICICVVEN